MFHLAQLNIAKTLAPMESEQLKDFVDGLDPVNEKAETTPGFVWRLKDVSGNATNIVAFDDPDILINMSVWETLESLKQFMFNTHHIDFLKRKKEWFKPMEQANYVLWWVPIGHEPTILEAMARLEYLRQHGETSHAFSFKKTFAAEDH